MFCSNVPPPPPLWDRRRRPPAVKCHAAHFLLRIWLAPKATTCFRPRKAQCNDIDVDAEGNRVLNRHEHMEILTPKKGVDALKVLAGQCTVGPRRRAQAIFGARQARRRHSLARNKRGEGGEGWGD